MCLKDGAHLVGQAKQEQGAPRPVVSVADHHLHIQSPQATAELRSVAERMPEMFAGLNPSLLQSRDGADAIRQLDDAGIEQGVLLSEGYMFTSPFATPGMTDAAELTRSENRFNVDAALASGGRLKAFVGINPFSSFALEELRFWGSEPGVAGVKLHLGNSGFDPKSEASVSALAEFVGAVRDTRLPLLVHVRQPGVFDPSAAQIFIDVVLSQAEGITVQLAHGGGGGGVEDAVAVLEHFADAIERGAPGSSGIIVDLSVVLVLDPTSTENVALLDSFVQIARRMGVERFVMGSDWPTLCSPREHDALITAQLPFTAAEWATIAANRAPYLD
jgi:predicted TIM-barrel fold metal-dependent hydrolase